MPHYSRKHHYLPQFYLRGFTDSGESNGTLHIFDGFGSKRWTSKPAGVAFEKDLYRVESRGVEPDALEKSFAQFEGQAARVLSAMIESEELPIGKDFNVLLNFVSLMRVRIPAFRDAQTNNMAQLAELLMTTALQSKERWEQVVEGMRNDGKELPERTSYEEMKEFFESKEYAIDIDQNWYLRTLLEAHEVILPLLAQRDWSVFVAGVGEREFITSDRPALLNWTTPVPSFYPPGLGLSDTEFKLPLGKRICLVGRFGAGSFRIEVKSDIVAAINSMIALQADRLIVSPQSDFLWTTPDGSPGGAQHWMDWIAEHRQGGEPE